MKLRIEIDTDNDSFGDYPNWEIGRILSALVGRIEHGELKDHKLVDGNGNTCGKVTVGDAPNAVRAMVLAYKELNTIRARDGVPFCNDGWKSDVNEQYFSDVVDGLDAAVREMSGKPAHCHPELYK